MTEVHRDKLKIISNPFMRIGLFFFFCCTLQVIHSQDTISISSELRNGSLCEIRGKIVDGANGFPLVGANLYISALGIGNSTDEDGNFTLDIPVGNYKVRISFIGYESRELYLQVSGSGELNIRLTPSYDSLEEIVIQADDPRQNIESSRMGVTRLSVETIEKLPTFIGETDILKSLVLLPGVSSVGEASSGVNVRGGGSDENLILLGGAPIYNPSHLFGYFSAFNSDLISNVTIYKGGVPSKYGGRASSIIDMSYKAGDFNQWDGELSLGTIASKVTAGGPIIKNKLSIQSGARVSYVNWLLGSLSDPNLSKSKADFYDANLLLAYKISDQNNIEASVYRSNDNFNLLGDDAFSWQNTLASVNWNYSLSSKLFLSAYGALSLYDFSVKDLSLANNFDYRSEIDDQTVSLQLDYSLNDENQVSGGVIGKQIKINPGEIIPLDDNSDVNPQELNDEKARIYNFFLQHDINIGRFALSYGARYSNYNHLGPDVVNLYDPLLPRSIENVTGSIEFSEGSTEINYANIEPRLSLRYLLGSNSSIKLGYNKMVQYLGLISNTTTIAPTDIWKLADYHINPLISDQYSIGLFKNFGDGAFETSLEAYYKSFQNVTEYKDGADLILNDHIETELLAGDGRAYGIEFLIKKNLGDFTGWLSYTYSRSERRVIGFYDVETINRGEWYPSNFDKPHDLTAVAEYKVGPKLKFSSVFTYSQGRPVSYPVAKFNYQGQSVAYYDLRNTNRIPDYHRLDLAMTFKFGSDSWIFDGEWIMSFYNLYGRKNAFSVFFDDVENEPPQAFRLSTLGTMFPSLSYKLEF